eukprot:568640-Prymnesium_polylepis.1
MPYRKVSRETVVSWCSSHRIWRLRPSDDRRDSSRSPIGALRKRMAAHSAAFRIFWAGDVM